MSSFSIYSIYGFSLTFRNGIHALFVMSVTSVQLSGPLEFKLESAADPGKGQLHYHTVLAPSSCIKFGLLRTLFY